MSGFFYSPLSAFEEAATQYNATSNIYFLQGQNDLTGKYVDALANKPSGKTFVGKIIHPV